MRFNKRQSQHKTTLTKKAHRCENNNIPQKEDIIDDDHSWDILNHTKFISNKENKFMSATRTANFLLDDPIIDWLELYYHKYGLNTNDNNDAIISLDNDTIDKKREYMNLYFDGGIKFEDLVFKSIANKWKNDYVMINDNGKDGTNIHNYERTVQEIKKGTPFIAQAVLYNFNNNTRGNADLIVRSDYINKLVINSVLTCDEEKIKAPLLKGNYHYVVIDVKWSTLNLSASTDLLKKHSRFPAYKGQIAIYNCALGNIQGYIPSKAYILGKGWKRENIIKKQKYISGEQNCFDRLGVIDYSGADNTYILKCVDAIKWYQNVVNNGDKWNLLKPENKYMYPNMSHDDMIWGDIKKHIASNIKEITQISNVGVKERNILLDLGIKQYDDPRCTSTNMGLNNTELSIRIDTILDTQRNTRQNIFPKKIQNNMNNWQESSPVDFYFDFETVNTMLIQRKINIDNSISISGLIFEIGIGWIQNKIWNFKSFYIEQANEENEKNMLQNFWKFIIDKTNELDPEHLYYPRLFHWTNAEINNLHDANNRHNHIFNNLIDQSNIKFVDMYKVFIGAKHDGFQNDPIGIKGALNYKLKTIGKALKHLDKITTEWPDNDISNGQIAMLKAAEYYHKKKHGKLTDKDKKIFEDIIKYNEIDCKIIWDITSYLRLNHNDLDPDYVDK